jgi:hypothetical protein
MKLSHSLALGAGGLSVLIGAFAAGCSSSSTGTTTTDSGAPPVEAGSYMSAKPPTSSGSATTSTTTQNFALHTLQLGDTDRSGSMNQMAWQNYGFDVDGKFTTLSSNDVCTRFTGAPSSVQVDGTDGTDNSFGSNILPLVQTVAGNGLDATLNNTINSGSFTVMFDITGLTSDPMQTNTSLSAQLFGGGKFVEGDGGAGMPTWTTADNWPVIAQLLNNPTSVSGGSKIKFPDAFIVNGTWVSGTPIATLSLQLTFSGQSLTLNVHQATITMQHSAANKMTNGTIAGVITTSELISSLMAIAGHLSTSLCSGAAFNSIATQIEQDSDIIHDGSNVMGTPCDAISIGLGFTADQIGEPTVVAAPTAPSPNPCGDGG